MLRKKSKKETWISLGGFFRWLLFTDYDTIHKVLLYKIRYLPQLLSFFLLCVLWRNRCVSKLRWIRKRNAGVTSHTPPQHAGKETDSTNDIMSIRTPVHSTQLRHGWLNGLCNKTRHARTSRVVQDRACRAWHTMTKNFSVLWQAFKKKTIHSFTELSLSVIVLITTTSKDS